MPFRSFIDISSKFATDLWILMKGFLLNFWKFVIFFGKMFIFNSLNVNRMHIKNVSVLAISNLVTMILKLKYFIIVRNGKCYFTDCITLCNSTFTLWQLLKHVWVSRLNFVIFKCIIFKGMK